jgi:hypothetical protein
MILSKVKNTFNKYRGLSTEEKPTNIPQHSSFLETDTGATYNYDGLQWNLEESGGSDGGSSGGGALYVHLVFYEGNQLVRGLQESYSDIATAVEEGKIVLGVWPFGDIFSAIMTLVGFGVNNGKYFVQFMVNDTKDFVADTSTDPLVLYVDDDSPSL